MYDESVCKKLQTNRCWEMKVLKTRRPVRGVRMKVGPKRRDIVVNVAPIIVDGVLKSMQ